MLWMRWTELYCAAVQDFWFGPPEPARRPSATIISLAAERAKRHLPVVRAS